MTRIFRRLVPSVLPLLVGWPGCTATPGGRTGDADTGEAGPSRDSRAAVDGEAGASGDLGSGADAEADAAPSYPKQTPDLCLLPKTSGATYYIAPKGSDSAAGTAQAPFKTFKKAVSVLEPGDTLILQDGTYTFSDNSGDKTAVMRLLGVSGTKAQPITIRAEHYGKAVLDGQKTCNTCGGALIGIRFWNAHWINVAGIEVKNVKNTKNGVQLFDWSPSIPGNNSDIMLVGMIIHHNAYWVDCSPSPGGFGASGGASSPNVTIANSIFHSNGRLAAEKHCTQAESDAINGWDQGLYSVGRGRRYVNNIFYDHQGGYHLKIMGYAGTKVGQGYDVVVSNNLFIGPSGRTVGHSVPGKDYRAAVRPWENDPSKNNVPVPLLQNNLFVDAAGTLDGVILLSNTASSFWPDNDAFNNITTSGKLVVAGSWPSPLTDAEIAKKWNQVDNQTGVADVGLNSDHTDLLPGSAAIDAGRKSDAPAVDFYCRPRDSKPDVGPFEL